MRAFACLHLQWSEYHTWLGGTKPPALADRLSGASDLLGRDVLDFTGDTWQQEKETNVLCETCKDNWAAVWTHLSSKRGQHFAKSLSSCHRASKTVHAHSQNNWTFLMESPTAPSLVSININWVLSSGPWPLYLKKTPNKHISSLTCSSDLHRLLKEIPRDSEIGATSETPTGWEHRGYFYRGRKRGIWKRALERLIPALFLSEPAAHLHRFQPERTPVNETGIPLILPGGFGSRWDYTRNEQHGWLGHVTGEIL